MINSSYPASLGKVVRSKARGLNISAYARAIRAGVAAKLSVSRSTPSATRNAVAACSAAARSAPLDGPTTRSAARGVTWAVPASSSSRCAASAPAVMRPAFPRCRECRSGRRAAGESGRGCAGCGRQLEPQRAVTSWLKPLLKDSSLNARSIALFRQGSYVLEEVIMTYRDLAKGVPDVGDSTLPGVPHSCAVKPYRCRPLTDSPGWEPARHPVFV